MAGTENNSLFPYTNLLLVLSYYYFKVIKEMKFILHSKELIEKEIRNCQNYNILLCPTQIQKSKDRI